MDLIKLTTPELVEEFFSLDKSRQGIISEKEASGVLIENDSKVVTETEKLFPLAGELLVLSEGKIFVLKPDAELQKELEEFEKGLEAESEKLSEETTSEEIPPVDPLTLSDSETKAKEKLEDKVEEKVDVKKKKDKK